MSVDRTSLDIPFQCTFSVGTRGTYGLVLIVGATKVECLHALSTKYTMLSSAKGSPFCFA